MTRAIPAQQGQRVLLELQVRQEELVQQDLLVLQDPRVQQGQQVPLGLLGFLVRQQIPVQLVHKDSQGQLAPLVSLV